MHKSEWRYALLLALFIIPAAVFANFIRVVVIILITYYFGDEAGQGFLHTSTGMLLFVVTLLSVFLLDRLLSPLRSEEHTSELQSLMRISYAVFCLKKKK